MDNLKEDFNEECERTLASLDLSKGKPTLFLHACCGPCLTYPLTWLTRYFKVTVGYINPNIYPEKEYLKREEELKRFVKGLSEETDEKIEVVAFPYDYSLYLKTVAGHEEDREGGERCLICHRLRLGLAYDYAAQHGFDYFTTVMSVSSKKPSALLNEIGRELQATHPTTKYLFSDFRKKDGQLKGINIAKRYGLYRQNYCGCSFSLKARQEETSHKKD